MGKIATVTIEFPVPDTTAIDSGADDELAQEWEREGSSDKKIAKAIVYALESQAKICWYKTVKVTSVSQTETGRPYDWDKEHVGVKPKMKTT